MDDIDLESRRILLEANADALTHWVRLTTNRETRRSKPQRASYSIVLRGGRPMVKCGDKLYPFISGGAERTVRVRLEALVSGYQAKMAQASASTRAFGANVISSAEKNKAAFTTLGLGAAAMGGAIALGFKMAASAAIDFESSFAGVRKTVKASEPEFAMLANGLREMSTQIPVNVNELNQIAEAAGQLGIKTGNILDFTRTVADLGVSTNLASDEAATSLARLANITQMPQTEFDRLGSSVVALGNNLATTEAEIVAMGLRIAGAGKQLGLTEAQILAIAGSLSSVGIEAQAGGSAISRVMMDMASEVETGGANLGRFAAVARMSTKEFKAAFERDAAGALVAFIEGLSNLKGTGMSAIGVLNSMGITEIRMRDALLRSAGAGDILRKSLELSTTAWEENSALTTEAEQRYGTVASQIEIFKNQVNDLAITFGQIMMPVLIAMLGFGGDVVDLFEAMPGPVRTLAVVLAGAAGGAALLAGGFLLLTPRIAAARTAMASMGIQGGLLRGSLSSTARFLMGPWGLALTAATVGLTLWSNAKQAAKKRTDEYVAAIEADSNAIGENTEKLIANRLEKEGVLEASSRIGVVSSDLVGAILGEADAAARLQASLAGVRAEIEEGSGAGGNILTEEALEQQEALDKVTGALEIESEALEEVIASNRRMIAATAGAITVTDGWDHATRKSTESTKDNTAAASELSGEFGDLESEMEEVVTAAEELQDAFDGLAGGKVSVEKALVAYRNTLGRLREAIKDNGNTLDINTQKGRDNRDAILGSVDAAFEHAKTVTEQTGNVERGTRTFQRHIKELMGMAEESGLTREAVRRYLRELNLLPKDVKTLLKLMGVEKAKSDVDRLKEKLDGLPDHKTIDILLRQLGDPGASPTGGGKRTHHTGAVAGTAGALRTGGLRPDEVSLITQRGEMVLAKGATAGGGADSASIVGAAIRGTLVLEGSEAHIEGIVVDVLNSDGDDEANRRRMGSRKAKG